jgi:hypothetical protein
MSITFKDRDEFQRRQIAEKAIRLLKADIDISPMVIDGGWGTGKTEFCRKLINLMGEEDTHRLVYIDAFQADHADEPLLTVLAEVINILPLKEEKESFIKKAIPAARYGLKILAKSGVAHLLRQDAADVVNDFDKEIQQAANKAIDVSVESVLKDHVKASESLKALQEALEEIAQDKPIILFIDELDRCRPDFAVNMLEIIKHTFNVQNVQFVLITNTQQLRSSINHCYGESVDAQRYLDKFLKYSFSLPVIQNANAHNQSHVSLEHYKNLVSAGSKLGDLKLYAPGYTRIVERLITTNSLSLREVETFVRYLEIYWVLTNGGRLKENTVYGKKVFTIFAICVFSFKPKIAESIINKEIDAKIIANILGVSGLSQDDQRVNEFELICYMICSNASKNSDLFSPNNSEEKKQLDKEIASYFNGDLHIPNGEIITICEDAINTLALQKG